MAEIIKRKWKHRLTEIDPINKTGVCAHCGPVKLRWATTRWRCQKGALSRELTRRYGLDPNELGRPEKCDVCGSKHRICYDHDHATMQHRGWLCDRCNRALGLADDNPDRLRALANYLEK